MSRSLHPINFYAPRLNAAIEYIDSHLAEPLSVSDLAAKTSFSLSHFRKIFTEYMKESPLDYLRRRRLERAARLVRYAKYLKIKEIAGQCGYQSPEAFDRAFGEYFGMTPKEWRAGGYVNWLHWAKGAEVFTDGPLNIEDSQVQVKTIQRFRVLYQRKFGAYTEGENALWSELAKLADSLKLGTQDCYGMGLDDPEVTQVSRCRFDACIRLPTLVSPPDHIPAKVIPGGYYAVLTYAGVAGKTADHWGWLFRTWLPRSGFMISNSIGFERYPDGYPTIGAEIRSELYLPVRK